MSYEVGDRVCIISESDVDTDDDWNNEMFKWCGQTMTIRAVSEEIEDGVAMTYYKMEEDIDDCFFQTSG